MKEWVTPEVTYLASGRFLNWYVLVLIPWLCLSNSVSFWPSCLLWTGPRGFYSFLDSSIVSISAGICLGQSLSRFSAPPMWFRWWADKQGTPPLTNAHASPFRTSAEHEVHKSHIRFLLWIFSRPKWNDVKQWLLCAASKSRKLSTAHSD